MRSIFLLVAEVDGCPGLIIHGKILYFDRTEAETKGVKRLREAIQNGQLNPPTAKFRWVSGMRIDIDIMELSVDVSTLTNPTNSATVV